MKATEKTLNSLLEEVNKFRTRVGLCPFFFLKVTKNLKLQNRHTYQLYVFPKGEGIREQALQSTQSANSLRLYLTGILDGIIIGTKIASKESQNKIQGVPT